MTAIWRRSSAGTWQIASPAGFTDEAGLHDLIAEAPELLPLSGSPKLGILGREVYLGGNSADLLAIEGTGRLAVIEVKLQRNSEARRAVIAQVLTYAAYLKGLDLQTLESSVLASHLTKRGARTVAEVAQRLDQQGTFDPPAFESQLRSSLQTGAFRLVVVLDAAPLELVRLAGYLESVAEQLTIDLVAVSRYSVGSEDILVPTRVEPGHDIVTERTPTAKAGKPIQGGLAEFRSTFAALPPAKREALSRLVDWAEDLERNDLCDLSSSRSSRGDSSLLPKLRDERVGLVTIWSTAAFTPWRSVFQRRAPTSLAMLDAATPKPIGQGHNVDPTDEVLRITGRAYQEAAGHQPDP